MSILDTLFSKKFKRNHLNEIEVLIHKDARRHAAHGFIVASNPALRIKRAPVAVVFPDHDEAPDLTQRVFNDLWEAMQAQGWTPHHVAAWASVGQVAEDTAAGEDEHTHGWNTPAQTIAPEESDIPAFLRRSQNSAMNLQELGRASAAPARAVLNFPRDSKRSLVDDPNVRMLVNTACEHVKHLDDVAREGAKVRFEAIASNGLNQARSNEYIADKLTAAVNMILSTHKLQESAEVANAKQ